MADFAKATPAKHKPVLLQESVDALAPALNGETRPNDRSVGRVFLDGTYGAGGHSGEVKRRFPSVEIIAIDQDPGVKEARTANFRDLDQVVESKVDAILLDLGTSSDQLEEVDRGFSFLRDEPLDMRMSKTGITAAEILNSWDEHAIELVLRGFGEEKYSRKIARQIVERRETKLFQTTFDLVEAVASVKPKKWYDRIHPATKTFQALRIAVNEELTALEEGLEKGFEVLKPGGRFAVISFHSLEDRIVKNFFRDRVREGRAKMITKKPITASEEEVNLNPRSRSAKLRVISKI